MTVKRSLFIVSIRTAYQSDALAIRPPVHNSVYAISALSGLFVLWLKKCFSFRLLASQDALEVMFVRDYVSVRITLTDVTLVSKDTFRRLRY